MDDTIAFIPVDSIAQSTEPAALQCKERAETREDEVFDFPTTVTRY
jgi:hypothetical protein